MNFNIYVRIYVLYVNEPIETVNDCNIHTHTNF